MGPTGENTNTDGDGSPVDKLMAGSRKKTDGREKIDNELLCYLSHKMDVTPHEKLVKITAEFYTDFEIKVAKDTVFDKIARGKRNITRKGQEKAYQNVTDILEVLHKVDPDKMPMFGAYDLNRLPPLGLNNFDMTSVFMDVKHMKDMLSGNDNVLHQIANLGKELCNLKGYVESMGIQLSQVVDHIKHKDVKTYANVTSMSMSPSPPKVRSGGVNQFLERPIPFSISPSSDQSHGPNKPNKLIGQPNVKLHQHQQEPAKPCGIELPPETSSIKESRPIPKQSPVKQKRGPSSDAPEREGDSEWKVQQPKRRQRRNAVIVGTCDGQNRTIKSRGRFMSLFISRLDPDIEPDLLETYIKDNFNVVLECTKLKTKYDTYSSYKVEGYCKDPKIFFEASKWPENILVKRFFKPKS